MPHYPYFPDRKHILLDGFWEFAWLGDVDWDQLAPQSIQTSSRMAVPGVFDSLPAYGQQRGVGLLRKRFAFDTATGERWLLRIGGMGLAGRIWFDNVLIGECNLPYSALEFEVEPGAASHHEILIAIDNRFDSRQTPLVAPHYDFYAYGGIYRSVELSRLPACAVDRVRVIPLDLEGRVRLCLSFRGESPPDPLLHIGFDHTE